MKILKSWLEEYVDLNLSAEEIADKLSLSGTSVEAIERGIDQNVVVVEIKNIMPHPDADRLRLATVFDGTEEMTVVCGAPNIEIGQKVPLAKVGAILPTGKIEKAKIRGVESCGMLCAPDELGLSKEHDGIFILPEDFALGLPLSQQLDQKTVFDIEITPNRGDCLSHIGIAREIATLSDRTIKKEPVVLDCISKKASEDIKVDIANQDLCPQYQARVIEGVKIAESPDWLKQRLIQVGAKPINNVVDVTNYVMLDLGQPLHAFDYDKIAGKQIIVRTAKGESATTLDGTERKLGNKHLVIADKDKPIAIAGVMGNLNSEISHQTKKIVLESAEFERTNIYKCSKDLGLSTDASYRFERGIDSNMVEYALNKAAKMIAELSGGKVLSGIVRDVSAKEKVQIKIEYDKINNLLGLDLSKDQMNHIFKLLGFELSDSICVVPSWRHDIAIWQDLAEEIGRIYGYDKVTSFEVTKTSKPKKSGYYYSEHVKDILVKNGFTEVYNYAFLSEEDAKVAAIKSSLLLEVANPIQSENKYLRNSLVPNLLKAIAKNSAFDQVFIFEVGHIYSKNSEKKMLAMIAAGKEAKAQIETAKLALAKEAGIPEKQMNIKEMTRDELVRFKIRKPVTYVLEIELSLFEKKFSKDDALKLKLSDKIIHYRPISKYPSLTRDLAFIVDKTIKPDEIAESIYLVSDSISRVELFDEFASDKFGQGKKNVAYHLYMSLPDRTMNDAEADLTIKEIIKVVKNKFNADLR